MARKAMVVKQQRKQKYATREYTRCTICGRPHSVLRKFGICRICFRELAYKGEIPGRTRGSLVAFETGETTSYGIGNAQERGTMFVVPAEKIYEGQLVGENSREDDMDVNPCKKKHVSNMRASGSDDAIRLIPPQTFSLEQALEHINDDELVEVTPKSIRMRKKVLDRLERGKMRGRMKNVQA